MHIDVSSIHLHNRGALGQLLRDKHQGGTSLDSGQSDGHHQTLLNFWCHPSSEVSQAIGAGQLQLGVQAVV